MIFVYSFIFIMAYILFGALEVTYNDTYRLLTPIIKHYKIFTTVFLLNTLIITLIPSII
nr:MAG TPA: hypothetical protein [Caudoviricetes sp.]